MSNGFCMNGTAQCGTGLESTSQSLNSDPYNLRSEELAMAECMQGMEIRRTWSEKEMVCAFGGQMFAGTPDGMFEAWDGALTCVQVVRVPLTQDMILKSLDATLALTVVTKVVKSQQWLRATHATPKNFVVFCWLPFTIPAVVADSADALMQRIAAQDPRFSLRLRVPAEPGALFPALFAYPGQSRKACKSFSESDVSTYSGEEQSDEEDELSWDITWAWDKEWEGLQEHPPQATEMVELEAIQEEAIDITEQPETVAANREALTIMSVGHFELETESCDQRESSKGQVSKACCSILGYGGLSQCESPQAEDEVRDVWDDGG